VSRLSELEARRHRLLAQCDRQRTDLAARFEELKEGPVARALGGVLSRTPAGGGSLVRPLVWAAALAGVLLLRRPRQLLMLVELTRTAISFGSRAAVLLRIFDQLRSRRSARHAAKS
jgi:hypothetical protein